MALCDKFELLPKFVELLAFRLRQYFFNQRLVVPKETLNKMETGSQTTPFVHVIKAVGEGATKVRARCSHSIPRFTVRRNQVNAFWTEFPNR